MQRTLTTLGLILSLLVHGCDDASGMGLDETSDRFCSLPDPAQCAAYLGGDSETPDLGSADAGFPSINFDAGTFADAAVDYGDASVGLTDAGATDGGGSEGSATDNPCIVDDCAGAPPTAVVCGNGTGANVSCQPSFFGACEWHFVCGTP